MAPESHNRSVPRMALRLLGSAAALAVLAVAPAFAPLVAQAPTDQAATPFANQAAAGAAEYAKTCAVCHGAQLEGGAGVSLTGLAFASRWNGQTFAQLVQTTTASMPMSNPGSLTKDQYYDIAAFLGAKNGQTTGGPKLDASTAGRMMQFAAATASGRDFPLVVSSAGLPPLPKLPMDAASYTATTAPAVPVDAELATPAAADWLSYNRDSRGQRFSPLDLISTANVGKLHPVCAYQFGTTGRYETSPVAYNGVLYATALGKTVALDGSNCKVLWEHEYSTDEQTIIVVNRGVALYKGMVLRSTPSGHLISLDAKTGKLLWDARVSSARKGNLLSAAPVAYGGKVFIAEAGADWGAPGHLHAFDATTGKHLWTFNFIPRKGEAGYDTWTGGHESGGGSSWSSFAFDPEKNLVYAPVGNPAPQMDTAPRGKGVANLYTNSVVAVNADTGKLAWYAQQIPNDTHDWDTAAAPSLYSQGGRDYMAVGSKDGYLYLYDRKTHKLITKSEVTTHINDQVPAGDDFLKTCPGILGGVEWNGPAYSPADRALYVGSVEWCGAVKRAPQPRGEAALYTGGAFKFDPVETASGWIRSIDAATGKQNWAFHGATPMVAGVTPTAGGVIFTGDMNGDFLALDAKTGAVLYRFNTGGAIGGGLTTYTAGGTQYVAVPSGNTSRTMWKRNGAATMFIFAVDK
jgi:alcohol dehydrogenase (cytochrome c)